jgi:hypothetical protein
MHQGATRGKTEIKRKIENVIYERGTMRVGQPLPGKRDGRDYDARVGQFAAHAVDEWLRCLKLANGNSVEPDGLALIARQRFWQSAHSLFEAAFVLAVLEGLVDEQWQQKNEKYREGEAVENVHTIGFEKPESETGSKSLFYVWY